MLLFKYTYCTVILSFNEFIIRFRSCFIFFVQCHFFAGGKLVSVKFDTEDWHDIPTLYPFLYYSRELKSLCALSLSNGTCPT